MARQGWRLRHPGRGRRTDPVDRRLLQQCGRLAAVRSFQHAAWRRLRHRRPRATVTRATVTDKTEILIDRAGPLVRAAVVEDGCLTDLHIDSGDRPSRLGDIVLGRVERIVTALNGAFIDIGGPSAGLLNASDLRTAAPISRKAARVEASRIGTLLRTGQPVLVQVKAEPGGDKGPNLTMDATLPGRFLVFTPFKPGISISRRIAHGEAKGRLTQAISGITAGLGGG